MSFTGIPELRESDRKLGAERFWQVMAGTLVWVGFGAWLAMTLDYPSAYGSSCHRKCLIESYWYSGELVRHRRALEYALFAYLWVMPALIPVVAVWTRWKYGKWGWRISPPE